MFEYRIHPSIGIARIGNSKRLDFYLTPETIGGRPTECDEHGNLIEENGKPKYVKKFKNKEKCVRKQAARFRIFKHDLDNPDSPPIPVDLADKNEFQSVKWTVHLANKKSAWYEFNEFAGDLMVGDENFYAEDSFRNSGVEDRKQLLIDFGPRSLELPNDDIRFDKETVPLGYSHHMPRYESPSGPRYGEAVKYLGEIRTDSKKDLIVLGGYGNAGGDGSIESFGGGDSWYDDISDGPVLCDLRLANGQHIKLDAWVIVGPPKAAPELVNITTLDDIMFDVGVRHLNKIPEIYDKNNQTWKENNYWNSNYQVNYAQEIDPIVKRMGHYRWVANIPSMMDFCMPQFDMKDSSDENKKNRLNYFRYFRKSAENEWGKDGESNKLFSNDDFLNGIPLVPLGSGSNSLTNEISDKFVELTRTQYYFLEQWAKGNFTTEKGDDPLKLHPLDHADVGNCAGSPMCPGIEVTFTVRNPTIYSGPFKIKHKSTDPKFYFKNGLDPSHEETAPPSMTGKGCEPGDLTKRMAVPWQADLFECTVQNVNFTDLQSMDSTGFEKPPLYFVYWWPPQSPWDVILGVTDPEVDPNGDVEKQKKDAAIAELHAAGLSAGHQVQYSRGINNSLQMVQAWSYLGFIVNQNEDEETRDDYPYFVEKERNHDAFIVVALAAANQANIHDPGTTKFMYSFYLKEDKGSN